MPLLNELDLHSSVDLFLAYMEHDDVRMVARHRVGADIHGNRTGELQYASAIQPGGGKSPDP